MLKKKASLTRHLFRQFKDGQWRDFPDETAPETFLDLIVESGPRKTLSAFPEGLAELVLGHALLDMCPPDHLPRIVNRENRTFTLRIEPGRPPASNSWAGPLPPDAILRAVGQFAALAGRWEATGCFHRAALWDPASGQFLRHVEDVSRHNCLDRLAGWSLTSGSPLAGQALFVTARVTASLADKAVRSGYAVMVSRSAATTAAIDLAANTGMALLGFSRENRFNVLADPLGRIG